MSKKRGIGLFICTCKEREEESLLEEAFEDEEVLFIEVVKDLCSKEGPGSLNEALKSKDLKGLIILCSHPEAVERNFYPLLFEEREVPSLHFLKRGLKERERIEDTIDEILTSPPPMIEEVEVEKSSLVIGGGIAGMEAALVMAESGYKVYLVEKSPSLGGRMAQLDKTFPTLDCSACILTPKMVDVARHPNIEVLTYAEVNEVRGHIGSFRVTIVKKARYIDQDLCTGCGLCASVCRLKDRIPSEFQERIGRRGAIFLPFPQAVPLCYTIDAKHCLFLTKGRCGKEPNCISVCERQAIDFHDRDEMIEMKVGSIVVATGFKPFNGAQRPEYSYIDTPQVMTGLELERLLSSSGPTGGEVMITTESGTIVPEEVAFIQCVGSRDMSLDRAYCSRVCCMYTAKQALLLKEKLNNVSISIYYMDVRSFGKGYEEFYDKVRRSGVHYVRGNPAEVYCKGEKMVVLAEDTLTSQLLEKEYDLVVLAVGMDPHEGAKDMAEILHLSLSPDGFFEEYHPKLYPMETRRPGIYLAGTCQGPKDIPDTVAQAKGAAAAAMIPLFSSRIQVIENRGTVYWRSRREQHRGGVAHG